jgi:hypothetical protein
MSRRRENYYDFHLTDYSNSEKFELGDLLILKETFAYTPVDYKSLGYVGKVIMCKEGTKAVVVKIERDYIVIYFSDTGQMAMIDTPCWWFKNLSHEQRAK